MVRALLQPASPLLLWLIVASCRLNLLPGVPHLMMNRDQTPLRRMPRHHRMYGYWMMMALATAALTPWATAALTP